MFEASCSGNFLWYILEAAHSWNAGYKEQSRESSHLARSLLRGLCVARKMDHKDDRAAVWLVFAKPSKTAHISPTHFSFWLRPRSRLDCPETFLSSWAATIVLDWFSTSQKWAFANCNWPRTNFQNGGKSNFSFTSPPGSCFLWRHCHFGIVIIIVVHLMSLRQGFNRVVRRGVG